MRTRMLAIIALTGLGSALALTPRAHTDNAPAAPRVGLTSGPVLQGWDDYLTGQWTDPTPFSHADLDGDRDVDDDDLLLLLDEYTGARVPYDDQDPDTPFVYDRHRADFDGDWDIDDDEVNYLFDEYTGPITPTDFRIAGTGVGEPFGERSRLSYDFNDNRVRMAGTYDDPDHLGREWEFVDYESKYELLDRQTLAEPAPIDDVNVRQAMFDHGFTPEDIGVVLAISNGINVSDVFDGFVDLTRRSAGEVILYVNGRRHDGPIKVAFGFEFYGVLFENGESTTVLKHHGCPDDCLVRIGAAREGGKIKAAPRCVPVGCTPRFRAAGRCPGGTYRWNVARGRDKTDPDTGTGPDFATTFLSKSDHKNDIIVEVTYTDPFGRECTDSIKLTSVKVTATIGTAPHLASPTCDNQTPHTDPFVDERDGVLKALFVGVEDTRIEDISLRLDPECPECCKQTRVGFIQNVISNRTVHGYDNGGRVTIETSPNPPCHGLPILDADPDDRSPFYPLPRKGSMICGLPCQTPFSLTMHDMPSSRAPICWAPEGRPVQKLTQFVRETSFRTWLVAEVPKGSGCYTCLHQWDWRIDYDVNLFDVDCERNDATVMANTACATNTYNGPCRDDDWAARKTSGGVANDCDVAVPEGF